MPPPPRIFAVVCARNESATIETTLRAFRSDLTDHPPPVEGVIVVDDWSADSTANVAASLGAIVTRPPTHSGKGNAMRHGAKHALSLGATHVFFADADLVDFTRDHVRRMIREAVGVHNAKRIMVCGLRDYGPIGNFVQAFFPCITGERIVSASLLTCGVVPEFAWDGYATETALGVVCSYWNMPVRDMVLPGHGIVLRHRKAIAARWTDYLRLARTVAATWWRTWWHCVRAELDAPDGFVPPTE